MPPVLNVSLQKLPASRSKNVRAGQLWSGMDQSHDVLELIAKAEGAARLVKGGTFPQTAALHLVEEPPIQK
jgi:hypothetical protein